MSAPHVLVLGSVLGQPFGGVRRHNAELLPRVARLLRAGGGSLTVLTGRALPSFELPDEVETIESSIPPAPPLLRGLHERRHLRRLLAAAPRFDLVHTAHHPAPTGLSTPYSITVHDLRALSPHVSPLRRAFAAPVLARSIGRAARVIAVSETIRAELERTLSIDPAHLSVVSNAADHFAPLPRAVAVPPRLLCLGHLEPRKNVRLLLEALAHSPDLPALDLAGAAKGAEARRLRALARRLGVEPRVRFLGAFAEGDLPRLLASAAAVVLPSRLEGFGIGVLEAQRAGVPLAISDLPAHREVAAPGTPRFDPRDPAGCARAIREALAQSEEALAAAAEAARRYTWDRSAHTLLEAWTRAGTASPRR